MSTNMSRLKRIKRWWAHAFAVSDGDGQFDPQERKLVDRLARFLVQRRMTVPALMVLEAGRPLNFIGSQLMAFLSPFLSVVFSPTECQRFVQLLEKRASVDLLIDAIVKEENRWNG